MGNQGHRWGANIECVETVIIGVDPNRVRMEPDLEGMAGHLRPAERVALARRYYRWAKQLWATAQCLDPVVRAPSPRGRGRPTLPPVAVRR